MSLFFKAAMKCDMGTAREVPMYIDKREVMEEQFRHDRLVEQCLQTEQLLHEIEQKHKASMAQQSTAKSTSQEGDDLAASGVDQTGESPKYRAPPQCTGHLSPEQRTPGSRAIQHPINDRANLWRQKLSHDHAASNQHEREERAREKEILATRQREAQRELNALVISRQVAAREAELEAVRRMGELEGRKRRVHPIDVLQRRIAQQLEAEIVDGMRTLEHQLHDESQPVDAVYEDEQLRAIAGYRAKMTQPKTIPQSNVLHY